MTIEERLNGAQIKAEGYRLLADCYYPPDQRVHGLIDDLANCLIPLCPEVAPHIQAMQSETHSLQDRVGDFARLFIGPFATPAPPYGSVYLDPGNRVMGDSAAYVRDLYLEMGLELSDECSESPDHISVELEFMHFLCIKEAEAASHGDLEAALYFSRKQGKFLEESMAWIGEFTERIRGRAGTAFYRALAECTSAFVACHLADIRKVNEVIEPQRGEGRKGQR